MGDVDLVKSDLGPVKPWVRSAAIEIVTACPYQIYWWWGAPGRGTGDHAKGLALDLMNYADGTTNNPGPERRAVQNWVKAYVMQHRVRLGLDGGSAYVIADRQIASDESDPEWTWREYDGSDPHTNHVHHSFKSSHVYQPPEDDDMATHGQTIIDMLKAQNAVLAADSDLRRREYLSLMTNVQQEDGRNDEEKARDAAALAESRAQHQEALTRLASLDAELDEIKAKLDNEGNPE